MNNYVTVGFFVEGTTDTKFLGQIIRRTFEEVAFDCLGEIEVYEPENILPYGTTFTEKVVNAATTAADSGIRVLCVHADADSATSTATLTNKITPAFQGVTQATGDVCRNLVAIIPIQMSEAWIIGDLDILLDEISTPITPFNLGLHRPAENYADPKAAIESAIRVARLPLPQRRRRDLSLNDLYQILGQRVDLEKLKTLSSYISFRHSVTNAYKQLGYLH